MLKNGTRVRAVDTNVVARFLLNDHPDQSMRAQRLLQSGAYLSVTVLMELGWLLTSRYDLSRVTVAGLICALLDLPNVQVEQADGVRWAVSRYSAGADLADMLHLVVASPVQSFATFDRSIASAAGENAPISIETLR